MATKPKECPNCGERIDRSNEGCVLHDLIQVLRERGDHTEKQLRKLHAECDADRFWWDIGNIVDQLGDGYYNVRD